MTMLAITKFLTWNGNTCTTVHRQLPLHLTDVLLFSVSRPGAAVGKGEKNNYWPSCHCNILSSTTLKQRRPSQRTPWFVCCLGMYESHFQRCNGPLEKNPMCSTVVSISKSYCYASHWIVKYVMAKDWKYLRRSSVPPWSWEGPRRFVVPVPGEGPLPPPVSGERPEKSQTIPLSKQFYLLIMFVCWAFWIWLLV